ncbi:hypothetical protein ACQ859_03305 [Roseateles chitinivorans]|uniref:hypothetical protein n=1 Tax=Roseateles chitinivorans TaxID=2917965 RepID=UPI003D66487F
MTSKNELKERLRSGTGKKQAIAIAVVLALGVAAGVGILASGGKSGGEESHAHEEAKGHEDGEHHGEAKAGVKRATTKPRVMATASITRKPRKAAAVENSSPRAT